MWNWLSQTALLREFPNASKSALTSQRFWDHMDKIEADKALSIWKNILQGVTKREKVNLSSVSYDGTNFYSFIDTFNVRCEIAKRGKNKQGGTICGKLITRFFVAKMVSFPCISTPTKEIVMMLNSFQ